MSGGIVAPEQVRRAVGVEVSDAGDLVIDAGTSEIMPGLKIVVHLPDAGVPGRVVAPEHVRCPVAVEVAGRREQELCRVRKLKALDVGERIRPVWGAGTGIGDLERTGR